MLLMLLHLIMLLLLWGKPCSAVLRGHLVLVFQLPLLPGLLFQGCFRLAVRQLQDVLRAKPNLRICPAVGLALDKLQICCLRLQLHSAAPDTEG